MRVAHQHIRQRFQLGFGIGRPRGVGRRVEHQPLGFWRDCSLQIGGSQLEAVLDRGRHEHRSAAADRHHFRIAHPIGGGDDDLVAGVQRCHEGVEQDLLAAGADNGLLPVVIELVLALELGGNRLAQFRNARNRGVFGLAAIDCVDRRCLDVVRSVKVRFTRAKSDDITALGFEFPRLLADGNGGGRFDPGKGVGEKGHGKRSDTAIETDGRRSRPARSMSQRCR